MNWKGGTLKISVRIRIHTAPKTLVASGGIKGKREVSVKRRGSAKTAFSLAF